MTNFRLNRIPLIPLHPNAIKGLYYPCCCLKIKIYKNAFPQENLKLCTQSEEQHQSRMQPGQFQEDVDLVKLTE